MEVEMGNTNEFKDEFLKRMFKSSSLDSPSDKFTKRIMDRIEVEVVEKAEADKPVIEPKYWILISAGLAVAAYMLFKVEWSFMQSLFGNIQLEIVDIPKVSFNFLGSFHAFFSKIHISPILIIAIVAVVSLITLDKILKNHYSTKLFFF